MLSIVALPVELWMEVISHMTREDLLQLRLCSSRTLLPIINQFLFETIYISVGAEEGRRGAARMRAVSRSTIAQHVRVLVLKVVSGPFPRKYFGTVKTTRKINALGSSDHEFRFQSLPVALIEYLQPTVKLSTAFADFLRVTHRLTTIRLTRVRKVFWLETLPPDYPGIYSRVVLQLLDGLSRVKYIPSLITLELCHCPFVNTKDSGRVDKAIASQAIGKITRLKVHTRGTDPGYRRGYREDLLDVFKDAYHLKGLCILTNHHQTFKDFINSPTQFEHLVQVQFGLLYTEASVFGPFIAKKLPQLEMLIIGEGHVREPGSWTEVFEVWRRKKSAMIARGQPLKLVVFRIGRLYDGVAQPVSALEIVTITDQLCAVQLNVSF